MSTYLVKYDLHRGMSTRYWDADDRAVRTAARQAARRRRSERVSGWMQALAIRPADPAPATTFPIPFLLPF